MNLFAEGQHGKELVAAGYAAKGRNAQSAPEWRAKSFSVFAGDALHFDVATDGAVSGKQMSERSGARTKTLGATRATPGNMTDNTGDVIKQRSSARPAAVRRITNRADHQT